MSKYNSSKWSNLYDEKLVTSLNNSHISSQYKEYNKFKDNIKDVPISTSLIDSYIDKNEILKENKNINDLDILFSKNLSEIKDDIMTSVNSSFITPVLNSSSSNSVLYNKNSLSTKYPVSEGKKDFHSLNSLNYSSMKSSKSDDILNTIFSSKYKTENEYKELDDFKQNKENIKYQKEIDNRKLINYVYLLFILFFFIYLFIYLCIPLHINILKSYNKYRCTISKKYTQSFFGNTRKTI